MLQQTIKIEQCITVMLYLEKQMYMSTQQKRAKKKNASEKKKLPYKVRNAHFVTTVRYLLCFTCNLKTQCHNCNSLKLKKKK